MGAVMGIDQLPPWPNAKIRIDGDGAMWIDNGNLTAPGNLIAALRARLELACAALQDATGAIESVIGGRVHSNHAIIAACREPKP